MKYIFAVATLFVGALAAPTNLGAERHMKAMEILHNNKHALGLSTEEMNTFDQFMASLHKRNTAAGAPASGAAEAFAGVANGATDTADNVLGAANGATDTAGNVLGAVNGATDTTGNVLDGAANGATDTAGNVLGGVKDALGGLNSKYRDTAVRRTGGKAGDGGLLGGVLVSGIL